MANDMQIRPNIFFMVVLPRGCYPIVANAQPHLPLNLRKTYIYVIKKNAKTEEENKSFKVSRLQFLMGSDIVF